MLGVATLIVVNSVMGGFSTKLRDRLHGLLSDVLIEARTVDGFPDPQEKMERIRRDPFLRDKIEAMSPTLEVFAMIQFRYGDGTVARPVRLIGIDPKSRALVGGFAQHLLRQKGLPEPSFELSSEARRRYEEQNPPTTPTHWEPLVNELALPGAPASREPPPPDPPPESKKVP